MTATRRSVRWAASGTAAAVLWFGAVGGPAGAQDPATTAPSPEGGATTSGEAPTSVASVLEGSTTTICVPEPGPEDLVFVGTAVDVADDDVRFRVDDVVQGEVAGSFVVVRFDGEGHFFDEGRSYRVVALPRVDGTAWEGAVRQPAGQCLPLTRNADGSAIDTSLFGRLADRWPEIVLAVALPTVGVLLVLVAVVAAKRLIAWAARS